MSGLLASWPALAARSALAARAALAEPDRGLALLDLALPRDVEPGVGDLPRVSVTDLETLAAVEPADARPGQAAIAAARQVVADELEAYLSAGRAARDPCSGW